MTTTTDNHPLNGGGLIIYLRLHYDEVVGYFKSNGLQATCEHYGVSRPTLERLIAGEYGKGKKLSMAERAFHMAEVATAGNAELRREVREMREEYSRLVELIAGQITTKIIGALKSVEIDLPPELDHKQDDDILRITTS